MNKKKLFIWCSPHQMTAEQEQSLKEQGTVLKLKDLDPDIYTRMLNIKYDTNLDQLARDILSLARKHKAILIQPAGNPQFQFALGKQIGIIEGTSIYEEVDEDWFISIWYAYSERVSKEETLPDGSVKKVNIFKFKGWNKF